MRAVVLLACALFACRSESSALSAADVDAIEASTLAMMAPARSAAPPGVDVTVACLFSGAVSTHGDCSADCAGGRCVTTMALAIDWSGDCALAQNLVVDGRLDFTLEADGAAMSGHVTGVLDVSRRSPAGGLLLIDACVVTLSVGDDVTGTVCGRAIQARW